MLYLGSSVDNPRKTPPAVSHPKWVSLVQRDPFSITLLHSESFSTKADLNKALATFRKLNKTQSLTRWVNSDYYRDVRSPYVYLIRHRPSGRLYVGSRYLSSANPSQFFKDYFTSSERVKALGWKSFEVLQVLACKNARRMERELLAEFYSALARDAFLEKFLNRSLAPGILLDEASIEKMKASKQLNSRKGIPHSPEHTANISKALIGHKVSEETKAKISLSARTRKRKPHSEETKAKLRAAALKRGPVSAETRSKISLRMKGRKASAETRKILSEAQKRSYKLNPGRREQISTSLMLAYVKDPTLRERKSVSSKEVWKNTSYKEAMRTERKARANTEAGLAHMRSMSKLGNRVKSDFSKAFKGKYEKT